MRLANGGLQLVMSLAVCVPLGAQDSSQVSQGSRVRVTAPSLAARPMVGWIDAVGPTTLTLVIRGDSVAVVPLDAVDRLELSVKRWNRGTRVKHAAGIGAILGVVSGALVGLMVSADCIDGQWCFRGLEILGYAMLGGLALGGVGAVVGASQPTEQWRAADFAGPNSSLVEITDQGRRR